MSDPAGYPRAPTWLRDVPLAHRGLHGDGAPENSLAAFDAAAQAGYGVELDVYLSRDGVPVIAHDASLERATGRRARIGDLTVEQLGDLRLVGSDQTVPTLAAALAVLGRVPVMVELKQTRPRAGRLEARTAAVLDDHDGPWCVASFNPSSLRWFRRNRPRDVRVLTATTAVDTRVPAAVRTRLARLRDLPDVRPHAVSYDITGLPNAATDAWRQRGGVLVTWTAVGPEGVARGLRLADNVIFEDARP